jgi:lipopolysaccharide assembly outer membrane protein LptD (OstA)
MESNRLSKGAELSITVLIVAVLNSILIAQDKPIHWDAQTFEIVRGATQDTIYLGGGVFFYRDDGRLSADSAVWIKGESIRLFGRVLIEDTIYRLTADQVDYDVVNKTALAQGEEVRILSARDSILAVGSNAYYCRDSSIFRMSRRPSIFLKYPDTTRMIQVMADRISLNNSDRIGYADGQVIISQSQIESQSGRAILYIDDEILALYDNPVARRRESEIRGDTLIIYSKNSVLEKIETEGNAIGDFKEPSNGDSAHYDLSQLKANRIEYNLENGALDNIVAVRQAYSFYSPGVRDSSNIVRNNVSGDTIKLLIDDERLSSVEILGGAEGDYYSGKYKRGDSGEIFAEDTISYKSNRISYDVSNSTIVLNGDAAAQSGNLSLTAAKIRYNTSRDLLTAYDDSLTRDSSFIYIPVILKDGREELLGSYLEYSLETEKGMIRQSQTKYQEGFYRGGRLYREEKEVYYVKDGRYTSCDLESPHFHFQSSNMKMIQGDKVIARPVVFYIEKIPLLIVPYYVFSIKPGRHSGFLPFRIGNFERGGGSITNVGYYWAASEYWDLQTALDYYENVGFNYRASLKYNARYRFSGNVAGAYALDSYYSDYKEVKHKRWELKLNHSHTVSPTLNVRGDGTFVSDKSYYTDFSTDLDDRLNRDIKSQISLSKQWSGASLSAQFTHLLKLDQESRSDELPTASLSLPSRAIFGSSRKKAGEEPKSRWYQSLYFSYGANLRNHSSRVTDTLGIKSRKEYLTVNHTPTLTISPLSLFKYLKIGPSVRYQETWYKIFETDQSLEAGIDHGKLYRRYSYGASISASTDLYGTIYPHLWGWEGFRHAMSPSVSFSWAPQIKQNDTVRAYTGVGASSVKQKILSFSLKHLFQAKARSGEISRNIDLLSISSSLSYNYEGVGQKFSELSTTAQTTILRKINMSASMNHSLYKKDSDTLNWQSPRLTRFNISTSFSVGGVLGSNAEVVDTSLSSGQGEMPGGEKRKWSLSVSHYYSESGSGSSFSKIHTVSFNLKFNLTRNVRITYWQNYDFVRGRTISRRIEVERDLHCWRGYFYWIPDGSNRGYYFKINVISIPEIKFEKSESGIRGALL